MGIIVPLITAPYISRVLGSEGVGINTFTASIVSYFTLFAALGIQNYGNREIAYHQKDIKERSKVFWELQIIQLMATATMILVFFIFLFFQDEYRLYFLIQGISLLTVAANISWFFMGLENFKIIVYRNTIINVLVIILTFTIVRTSSDLWLYILLITGASLFANISVWPFLRHELQKISIRELNLRRHFLPALTLLLPQIVMVAYASINKTMLGMLDSVKSAGFFNQANIIVNAAFYAASSFAGAFLPRVSNLFSEGKIDEGKRLILQSFQMMYFLSVLAIAGVMGVSGNFATFYFGSDFKSVGPLMAVQAWNILFFGIATVIRSQYLMAMRRMREITIASLFGLLPNILFNIVLIPTFGAMGASITVVITETAAGCYLIWTVRNDFKYREMFQGIWKYFFAGVIAFVVVFTLNRKMPVGIVGYGIQAVSGSITYMVIVYVLKSPIVVMLKNFRGKRL